jgi:hypothetical protein
MIIPKNQGDILVKDFLKYKDYILNVDKEKINEKEILYKTINIFFHLTDREIDELPYTTIKQSVKIIENVLNQKVDLIRVFELDGVEYGLLPNFDDMTFGEMVDCDTDDVMQQIAVLYRPIIKKSGDKYLIEKYKADISHIDLLKEKLTLDVYNSFVTFFLTISQNLLVSIQNSMVKKQVSLVNWRSPLERNGLGILGFSS